MEKVTKYLNHGDICNEIETRLGLCESETGEKLKSENTTFEVIFLDYKDLLTIKIQKE